MPRASAPLGAFEFVAAEAVPSCLTIIDDASQYTRTLWVGADQSRIVPTPRTPCMSSRCSKLDRRAGCFAMIARVHSEGRCGGDIRVSLSGLLALFPRLHKLEMCRRCAIDGPVQHFVCVCVRAGIVSVHRIYQFEVQTTSFASAA